MKSEKKFKQPYKGYKWQKTSYVKYELGLIDELPFIVEGEDMPELRKPSIVTGKQIGRAHV